MIRNILKDKIWRGILSISTLSGAIVIVGSFFKLSLKGTPIITDALPICGGILMVIVPWGIAIITEKHAE